MSSKPKGRNPRAARRQHFNADPIAESSLRALSDVFPTNWKSLSSKQLSVEIRKVVANITNKDESLSLRNKSLMVLDNLAWHSKTKHRLLDKDIDAVALLCDLSFGEIDARDIPCRSLALNNLNKMALSNSRALLKRGVLKELILLGQAKLKEHQEFLEKTPKTKTDQENDDACQRILLCVANVFLTFANDRDFSSILTVGNHNARGEDGSCVLDLVITFLNSESFNLSLRGSSGMALMKMCEICRSGDEAWHAIIKKVIETNTIRTLVRLLLKKSPSRADSGSKTGDDKNNSDENCNDNEAEKNNEATNNENDNDSNNTNTNDPGNKGKEKENTEEAPSQIQHNEKEDLVKGRLQQQAEESFLTNKSMILDVLYQLSNLDNEENESDTGEIGDKIIKAGGCLVCARLVDEMIASPSLSACSVENNTKGMVKLDTTRGNNCVQVIRASVTLLSSMAFVAPHREKIITADGINTFVKGICNCFGDAYTISYGCRAMYVLEKDNIRNLSTLDTLSEDELAQAKKVEERISACAKTLVPLLVEVINSYDPAEVKHPSNPSYMLRHICLLFFLFSSVPSIKQKMIEDPEYAVLDSLYLMLKIKISEIKVNALAVIANFVETEDGAALVCGHDQLVKLLVGLADGSLTNDKAIRENVSYAIQGIKQKAPKDELERLGIDFEKLSISNSRTNNSNNSNRNNTKRGRGNRRR